MSDRYSWLIIGVISAAALYTAYRQLETFKKRCVTSPSEKKNVGVEQATEDGAEATLDGPRQFKLMCDAALKLETLHALARGVNPELRNAALKIITERGLREGSLNHILREIESDEAPTRLRGLQALKVLCQNASPKRLLLPPVFAALVSSLRKSHRLPRSVMPAQRGEREAIWILNRLVPLFPSGHQMAIDAGIIDWLKEYNVPDYASVIDAVSDPDRFDINDSSFYELVSALCEEGTPGRRMIQDIGLVRDMQRSLSEGPNAGGGGGATGGAGGGATGGGAGGVEGGWNPPFPMLDVGGPRETLEDALREIDLVPAAGEDGRYALQGRDASGREVSDEERRIMAAETREDERIVAAVEAQEQQLLRDLLLGERGGYV